MNRFVSVWVCVHVSVEPLDSRVGCQVPLKLQLQAVVNCFA